MHKGAGYSLLAASAVAIFFGLDQIGASLALYVAYGVLVGLELVLFIVLEVCKQTGRSVTQKMQVPVASSTHMHAEVHL